MSTTTPQGGKPQNQIMSTRNALILAASLSALLPVILSADSFGPVPRVTGAPGDSAEACTLCHVGTALNAGGGKVEILLPSGATYTPGVKQHIQVRVSDPAQHRWGFEFTARLNSDLANGQAGSLTSTDSFTQTFCDDGRPTPCASATAVQFISHTTDGTRNGTPNGATFDFDWTPPATAAGAVTFYVAGNAANGNGQPTGDHIYTANVQLTAATGTQPGPKPTISSNGVVNAASFNTTVAPNSWLTIFGTNFATATRSWRGDEIVNGKLPTSLDGLSVMVNNKPAYVAFISPGQINVLAPNDSSSGPVQVQVTTANGSSDPSVTQMQAVTPSFFLFDGKYLAATHADGSSAGKTGLFASAPNATTPVKPGETIILYGNGFGPTSPAAATGQVVTSLSNLPASLQITIGGIAAKVLFGGLIPGYAGLYQFNVEVPAAASDGDQPVVAQVGGTSTPAASSCCFITVQH